VVASITKWLEDLYDDVKSYEDTAIAADMVVKQDMKKLILKVVETVFFTITLCSVVEEAKIISSVDRVDNAVVESKGIEVVDEMPSNKKARHVM
jgi:hypothetical protein